MGSEKIVQQPSTVMSQSHFSQVPAALTERSMFDRSHSYLTAFDAGLLVPILIDEIVPGDTVQLDTTSFCRLATPLKPFMDNVFIDFHAFFVPNRLLWRNWQRFMGEQEYPDDDVSDLVLPVATIAHGEMQPDDLANYFAIPPLVGSEYTGEYAALHFRAYSLIWNSWFRDQNLQDPTPFSSGDGPDTTYSGMKLLPRGKRKDYFTSALPWPQKGDPVVIPIGDEAPIVFNNNFVDLVVDYVYTREMGTDVSRGPVRVYDDSGSGQVTATSPRVGAGYQNGFLKGSLDTDELAAYADLSQASPFSINDFRTAYQIQRLLEKDARGGTRYIELNLYHFGVKSDDSRMQRPELLGTGTSRVNINPVASTVASSAPQGNLAATGTQVGKLKVNRSFTEHGVFIVLASARADLKYQQGVHRMWSRRTRLDFPWPSFAHLGEQAILNKEIFLSTDDEVNDQVFGYQERYGELRYFPSRVTGIMNSGFDQSLSQWHLAQYFDALPVLNGDFIRENPPLDRVIAVPSEPHFIGDFWHDYKHTRPFPVYGVPGLSDGL